MVAKLSHVVIALLLFGSVTAEAAPPTTEPAVVSASLTEYRRARQDGGPGKDGIPSIDRPRFGRAEAADGFLDDDDRVIGLYVDGVARAYPQRILVWHEIVNDTLGDQRISVTYCPLTGTSLGFERGDTEFGVSGKLVNSNLVMYDRATDTEYPQILAAGIDGELRGRGLTEVRLIWTTWGRWKQRHPDTEVLSTRTGSIRNYQRDPYGNYNPLEGYYEADSRRIFPVLNEDRRYPLKLEVLGFRDAHEAVAIEPATLREARVLVHEGPGGRYVIVHDPVLDTGWVYRGDVEVDPDSVTFDRDGPAFDGVDQLEPVNAFEAMWFAWAAFYPDTHVIDHAQR